jgi:hypothetical protein
VDRRRRPNDGWRPPTREELEEVRRERELERLMEPPQMPFTRPDGAFELPRKTRRWRAGDNE